MRVWTCVQRIEDVMMYIFWIGVGVYVNSFLLYISSLMAGYSRKEVRGANLFDALVYMMYFRRWISVWRR